MLSHIRKTCGFENVAENLDLASESGEVMDLASKGKEYARKYLEPRTSYILVKVIGDESEDSSPTYVPLLDNAAEKIKFSITNPNFKKKQRGTAPGKTEDVGTAGAAGTNKANISKNAKVEGGSAAKEEAKKAPAKEETKKTAAKPSGKK
ncbi:hypothetical protein HDV03_002610 [Kappamyces sp. JEL0829]|nr:hypothetical protein HDV03_002610 [Kappamyces sp. JEL0829]